MFFFSKNTQISNFIKLRPVGVELFQADGETGGKTDMTKLIIAFHNFTNVLRNRKDLNSTCFQI
jgi:hypothetical protein